MKSTRFSRAGHRAAWAVSAALIFACNAVQACPGCKQATEGRGAVPLNGASIGFSLSIFFMIAMIVSIIGGLGYMTYRSCRILAARERALLAEEETRSTPAVTITGLQPRPA